MQRFRVGILSLAASFAFTATTLAEEPPNFTYSPQPPGTIVASQVVYLAGQAMHSQWRGVLSKKFVGQSAGMNFYQWYVSIYAIDDSTYRLKYQSPGNGGPYDKLSHTSDASMWFPAQSGSIVGAAQLMGSGIEQLVVVTHQTGADCGSADLTIFAYDSKKQKVVPAATVENGCELQVKIVHDAKGADTLLLSGPYYNDTAPMCCPTKPKASATLSYINGTWVEKPNYYKLFPNAFPHYP
jgi:hypothetical protein